MGGTRNSMITVKNIVLWFCSLLLSVSLFSRFYGPVAFSFVFRITMIFALPVAFLYLPFVIKFNDAEDGRIWAILGSGTMIGPASLALWALILDLKGTHSIWQGDGIGLGLAAGLILALVVGFLTTTFYVIALKVIHRWITMGENCM
jgi:hypothetical protein